MTKPCLQHIGKSVWLFIGLPQERGEVEQQSNKHTDGTLNTGVVDWARDNEFRDAGVTDCSVLPAEHNNKRQYTRTFSGLRRKFDMFTIYVAIACYVRL